MVNVFTAFFLKHFICDFPLQNSFQYKNKGIYGHPGGVVHSAIHAFGTLMLCVIFELPFYLSLIDFVIHYHIDWSKVKLNSYFSLKPDNSEYFWWLLGLDQLLHYLTYTLLIWIAYNVQ